MKKKIIMLLLAIFACFTIAACEGGVNSEDSSNASGSQTESGIESGTESGTDSGKDSSSGGTVVTPIQPGGDYSGGNDYGK